MLVARPEVPGRALGLQESAPYGNIAAPQIRWEGRWHDCRVRFSGPAPTVAHTFGATA